MLRRSFLHLVSAPTNHLGQRFPPAVALALQKVASEKNFSSPMWVTKNILEEYAQTPEASFEPTIIEVSRRPMSFYNAGQIGFYIPKGVGFVYRGSKAKEMVLASKLHGFSSFYWSSVAASTRKGHSPKPDQHPVLIEGVPYFNADQMEGGDDLLAAADSRVRSLPTLAFRSIAGKRYGREMCADLAEFLANNRIARPGHVWGTAKGFQKYSIFIKDGELPFPVVTDDGSVFEMYNAVQTTEPVVAEQLGLSP